MTIRTALIFYISVLVIAIAGAWALAYYSEWWVGMALLTILVLEHAWRVVKRIRKNQL
jgi:positive regulator of sigma E activity